jgi:hypothetical protein
MKVLRVLHDPIETPTRDVHAVRSWSETMDRLRHVTCGQAGCARIAVGGRNDVPQLVGVNEQRSRSHGRSVEAGRRGVRRRR